MGAAVLMLLPHAPIIHQVHPFSPLVLNGGRRYSCSEEVQLQQLAQSEEQRKPETTKSPKPTLLLLSSSHHNRMTTGLGREGINQTN